MKEISFSWGGFNSAMISNLGMVFRGIYSKKALNDYKARTFPYHKRDSHGLGHGRDQFVRADLDCVVDVLSASSNHRRGGAVGSWVFRSGAINRKDEHFDLSGNQRALLPPI